jgi:dienelactone hydrolase
MGPETKQMAYEMADAEAQVRDVQFLIGFAQSLPQSDVSRLAVAGWSWGGMNNVFAAARDSRIAALISLDGTREPALTKLIPPQRITAPWLYVARTPDTVPAINRKGMDTSFSLLNEAKYADVYQLTMYPMTHVDVVSRQLREAPDAEYTEYSRDEVARAYGWLVRYVHQFLNAQLKQDAQGLAFINNTPRKNGVPAHMMLAETRHAEPLPPSRAGLAAALAQRGFSQAHAAYQEAQKRDPKFTLSEADLKSWGYGLLGKNSAAEAVGIFTLWTILYPDDWDAFDSLAEACEQRKDTAQAIKHYRRSVQLNPNNRNGVRRLEALAPIR